MSTFIVENFRCFKERRNVVMKPVTLLVGENSSGKSTFLALAHYARRATTLPRLLNDFNEEPFRLGAYDQIAHYHGGQAKRATSFSLGREIDFGQQSIRLLAEYRERSSQPVLSKWSIESSGISIEVDMAHKIPVARLAMPGSTQEYPREELASGRVDDIFFSLHSVVRKSGKQQHQKLLDAATYIRRDDEILSAPIRSKPRRTYDPQADLANPEGDHVPMLMSKLQSSDDSAWTTLRQELQAFGRAAGLMKKIELKRKGKKASDPFQIDVAVEKFPFNLVDVGYGVSQVLPILVDSIKASEGSQILLQQPEVHLHPKAQAELGSFIAVQAQKGRSFIVETHSDYLVDRILADVRDGKGPQAVDVQILFFERVGSCVDITPIQIAPDGNLISPPEAYRSFFRDEQSRTLGLP